MKYEILDYIMSDEEVIASGVTSYQIACVIASLNEFHNNQPERLNPEDAKSVCDSLNSADK